MTSRPCYPAAPAAPAASTCPFLEPAGPPATACQVSLWLAQQFAADMQSVFPHLNVRCVSTNKLLGISGISPRRTFFAGAARVSPAQVRDAAVLLISQSGQTFPSLHATRLFAQLCPGRVWLLSGTPDSKMEQVSEGFKEPAPASRASVVWPRLFFSVIDWMRARPRE